MAARSIPTGWSFGGFLDYFLPKEMLTDAEQHRRGRMFMLSHVMGPIIGATLPIYMWVMNVARDHRVIVFYLFILAFWIYPFMLRWTKRYKLLAFISVQNLACTVLWACYAFGGMASPFLPWVLIFPLLAFLYLPPIGWVRNVLLLQIFGNTALLFYICLGAIDLPPINFENLEIIGMISMASVALYFAMMSLYFAKMFHDQREFGRELNSLFSSSDNLRNLTSAAKLAGAAKADFIAGMSHELRTPLNAIIGYSQLLLEEAEEENDTESVTDLGHVHNAGSSLLYLIDHILDYSRIDAGKMPINPSFAVFADKFEQWQLKGKQDFPNFGVELVADDLGREPIFTDWTAMSAIIANVIAGLASDHGDGRLMIGLKSSGDGFDLFLNSEKADGASVAIDLRTGMFDNEDDISPTKYGGIAIEIALAGKYVDLLEGDIFSAALPDGTPTYGIHFLNRFENTDGQSGGLGKLPADFPQHAAA